MLTTREQILFAIKIKNGELAALHRQLVDIDTAPENHRYESLEIAEDRLHDLLYQEACDSCGDGEYGEDELKQKFYVGEQMYEAVLSVEYNRHDKRFYYVECATLSINKL